MKTYSQMEVVSREATFHFFFLSAKYPSLNNYHNVILST